MRRNGWYKLSKTSNIGGILKYTLNWFYQINHLPILNYFGSLFGLSKATAAVTRCGSNFHCAVT